jgi:hypothetical protein
MSYRGRLLRGADGDLYAHMGFQGAWYVQRVVELVVDGGRVSSATDRSAELAEVRRRLREEPSPPAVVRRAGWLDHPHDLARLLLQLARHLTTSRPDPLWTPGRVSGRGSSSRQPRVDAVVGVNLELTHGVSFLA